jgi:uncharacterized protein YceH (UPF0502 family)
MELTAEEIRVLGCLVEKEATTPDNYPLSSNALVNACNQSTSRDPVVQYSERQIDQAMLSLREGGLARTVRGDGQRVHKHKHIMGEALHLDRPALAVLSVLMLRGAQTAAECKARSERYDVELDAAGAERMLEALAARDDALVRQLPRRPGEREARWVHLLGDEALTEAVAASTGAPARAPGTSPGRQQDQAELAELRARVDELTRRFDRLLERLGESVE